MVGRAHVGTHDTGRTRLHHPPSAVRTTLKRLAVAAGIRRRIAPHQLRHAHAVEMAREGVPLNVIQRQLGHANLGITSVYLQGIDNSEIINTVYARPAPMLPASAGLRSSSSSEAAVAGRAPTAASPASTEKLVVRRRTVRSLLMALAG